MLHTGTPPTQAPVKRVQKDAEDYSTDCTESEPEKPSSLRSYRPVKPYEIRPFHQVIESPNYIASRRLAVMEKSIDYEASLVHVRPKLLQH